MKLKSIEVLLERINRYKISPTSMDGKPLILVSPKGDVYDDNEWSYLDNFLEVNIKANILPEYRQHLIQTIRKEVEGMQESVRDCGRCNNCETATSTCEVILFHNGRDQVLDYILTLLTTLEEEVTHQE